MIRRFRVCGGWGVGWNLHAWALPLDVYLEASLFVVSVGPFYIERCSCCD